MNVSIFWGGGNYDLANDVLALSLEVVRLRLWDEKRVFRSKSKSVKEQIESFIARTVINKTHNLARAQRKKTSKQVFWNTIDYKISYTPSIKMKSERYDALLQEILSEKQIEILWLLSDGYSYSEISTELAISIGNVCNTISTARKKSKEVIKAVAEFEKLGVKHSRDALLQISVVKQIHLRTLVSYYNIWIKFKGV